MLSQNDMTFFLKAVKTSKKRLKPVLGKFPFDRHTREIPEYMLSQNDMTFF